MWTVHGCLPELVQSAENNFSSSHTDGSEQGQFRAVLLFLASNKGFLPGGVDASSVLADAWVDDDLAVVVPHSLGLSNVD